MKKPNSGGKDRNSGLLFHLIIRIKLELCRDEILCGLFSYFSEVLID